jgi:hypothetical protein
MWDVRFPFRHSSLHHFQDIVYSLSLAEQVSTSPHRGPWDSPFTHGACH